MLCWLHRHRLIILMGFIPLLSGCFSSDPKNIAAFKMPDQVIVTSEQYELMPPDEITIHCSRVPEIDGQSQRIRPDGKISFESLGEIEVAGKTPEQVAEILEQKVASLYTLPGEEPIDVRLVAYQSKSYYVLGQVNNPGRKLYTGRDSVLDALADAMPDVTAWNSRIQVIRPSADEDSPPQIFEVNFDWMQIHGDLRKNVLLEENDIVYVPPTPFAAAALALEQVLRPIARAFTGAYILERGTGGGGISRNIYRNDY